MMFRFECGAKGGITYADKSQSQAHIHTYKKDRTLLYSGAFSIGAMYSLSLSLSS